MSSNDIPEKINPRSFVVHHSWAGHPDLQKLGSVLRKWVPDLAEKVMDHLKDNAMPAIAGIAPGQVDSFRNLATNEGLSLHGVLVILPVE